MLLGSAQIKAVREMLMKSTPGVNFINVKPTNFLYKRHFGSFYYVHVTRKKLPKQRSYEKFMHLTLMKLTAGYCHTRGFGRASAWILRPRAFLQRIYFQISF